MPRLIYACLSSTPCVLPLIAPTNLLLSLTPFFGFMYFQHKNKVTDKSALMCVCSLKPECVHELTHFLFFSFFFKHSTCCLVWIVLGVVGGGAGGGFSSAADSSLRALTDMICLVQLNATMCA